VIAAGAVAVVAALTVAPGPVASAHVGSASSKVPGGPVRLPPGARALGPEPATSSWSVDVVLAPTDPAGLQAFDQAVSTPGSPEFRHFLTPSPFARRFGPAPGAVAAVRSWLAGEGLRVGSTRDGFIVPVAGDAARLSSAFAVGFEQVRLPSGRSVREPTARPSVPVALSRTISGVVGLGDLARPAPHLARPPSTPARSPAGAVAGPSPRTGPTACAGAVASGGTTADQLAQAYSMSSLYGSDEGQGVTVGVYELESYSASDIAQFESCYGVSTSVSRVDVDEVQNGPGSGEAALDIEMVAGMAPRAAVKVFVGPDGGVGPLDTYAAMVEDSSVSVISTSWGECEPEVGTALIEAEAQLFAQAAAQGQTVVAAAGDEGSEDCDVPGISDDNSLQVDDPASQPWVTAVGGTELEGGPPPTETVWNTGIFQGTGGGGISREWTMPSWQLGPGVESAYSATDDTYTGASPCPVSSEGSTVSCRQVPDVSAAADPRSGYAVFCSCLAVPAGGWQPVGGTSMAAPLWAALSALAEASVSPAAKLGAIDPALYQAGCLSSRPFNDVTSGNNQPDGSPPSDPARGSGEPDYPATSGYDLASGLGSPVASALVPDLVTPVDACPAVTGMSVSSGPAPGGTSVTLTGSNLGSVGEVDFGPGHPGSEVVAGATSVRVTTPQSPTGGWDKVVVVVHSGNDVLGLDGRDSFTFVGSRGYWTVGSDGGIFTFGAVPFERSLGAVHLVKPVVGMAPTPSGRGYFLVASDGGVFALGDAVFRGSMGGRHLDAPVVGMASTPDGGGYFLVASDGGVFTFGDAGFYGSTGGRRLTRPVVGMATPFGAGGYFLVASDGGVFAFGAAAFAGSMGGRPLNAPMVGIGGF
jgi:subtilase family serine protease